MPVPYWYRPDATGILTRFKCIMTYFHASFRFPCRLVVHYAWFSHIMAFWHAYIRFTHQLDISVIRWHAYYLFTRQLDPGLIHWGLDQTIDILCDFSVVLQLSIFIKKIIPTCWYCLWQVSTAFKHWIGVVMHYLNQWRPRFITRYGVNRTQ